MIKVSALYPHREGGRFDFDYYVHRHTPMVMGLLGSAVRGFSIERGVASIQPGMPAPYVASAHFLFDSLPAFQSAFGVHAERILADLPHYTNLQPVIYISEVVG